MVNENKSGTIMNTIATALGDSGVELVSCNLSDLNETNLTLVGGDFIFFINFE